MKDFVRTCTIIHSIVFHLQIQTEAFESTFESTMCLEHALEIYAVLQNGECPTQLLESKVQPCRYTCMGKYDVKIGHKGCISHNISFNLTDNLTSTFKSFPCGVENCNVDFIRFTCWKNDNLNIVVDASNPAPGGNDTTMSTNRCMSSCIPRRLDLTEVTACRISVQGLSVSSNLLNTVDTDERR